MSENTIYLVTGSFDNELEIFQLKPDKQSDRFLELVTFMSHGKRKNISSQECMYILCIYKSRYLNEKLYACIYFICMYYSHGINLQLLNYSLLETSLSLLPR